MFRPAKYRLLAVCLAGSLMVGLSSCRFLPNQATDVASVTKRFQKTLDKLRDADDFPGATAAFVLPDGTVVGISTGLSNAEAGTAMTPGTLQPIGAVEESFVSLVALSLEQEGVVDLDERLYHYFDLDEKDAWLLGLPNAKRITLRHLLTHSSGLVDETAGDEEVKVVTSDWSAGDIEFSVESESGFKPGEGFSVVDSDYTFARMALEQASSETVHSLVESRILDALELTRTETFAHSELETVAAGYTRGSDGTGSVLVNSLEKLKQDRAFEREDGGLLSNPQDLVRWAQVLYEEDALEKPYMEELFASGYRGADRDSEFGLGVYIHDTTAGEAYGHSSSGGGYETNLIYFPKYRVGVCVQVNRSYGNDLRKYVETLAQIVLNAIPE